MLFSERLEAETLCLDWCYMHDVDTSRPMNVFAWLLGEGRDTLNQLCKTLDHPIGEDPAAYGAQP